MSDSSHLLSPFVRQLNRRGSLASADIAAILAMSGTTRFVEPAAYLVREGEPPRHCTVLLSGFAFRQKLTQDGARQIVGLHIPGDALDFQSLYLDVADHNVQALTRCEVLQVPRMIVQRLVETSPAIARVVVLDLLVEASIMREWLLNIGRRDARTRLSHFLCEFAFRMEAQGLGKSGEYELPMTQEQLGDALGLTSVHVNRTLRVLEEEGVLVRRGRQIHFSDWHGMRRIADFSALYLHLEERNGAT